MKVAVISEQAPVHGRNLVEVCKKHLSNYDFTFIEYDDLYDTGYELANMGQHDILVNFGYFVDIGTYLESVRRAEPDLKIVNCWIGSDILQNIGHYYHGIKQHAEAAHNYVNICDAPKFAAELKDFFGIEARVIKTCPKRLFEVCELPPTPRFATYLPQHRRAFYSFEETVEIMSLNLDTSFHVLHHAKPRWPNLPNVTWSKWVEGDDYERVLRESTGMLRIPLHDGFSIAALEFLSMGRYVINRQVMPFCFHAPSMMDATYQVRHIREFKEPNYKGAEWVRENFSPEQMAITLGEVLDAL